MNERLVALKEVIEERDLLAAELAANAEPEPEPVIVSDEDDPTVFHSRDQGPPLRTNLEGNNSFLEDMIAAYPADTFFKHILAKLNEHSQFFKENNLLFCQNRGDEIVLCVPKGIHADTSKTLHGLVIKAAHAVVGHFGPRKTSDYVRRWYWWSCIYSDVTLFCKSCKRCQQSKTQTLHPFGLLHSLPIPNKPWESIAMDFVGPFPEVEGHNYLWVVICHLTLMVHLIPINTSTKATELSWLFLREVIRLHRLPISLVSDQDSKFTSRWWRKCTDFLVSNCWCLWCFTHRQMVQANSAEMYACDPKGKSGALACHQSAVFFMVSWALSNCAWRNKGDKRPNKESRKRPRQSFQTGLS